MQIKVSIGAKVVRHEVAPANSRELDPAGAGSPTRPPRADAMRNRELLLAAAASAFSTDGAQVPLEDIAHKAGVGVGTLYRHFPTRASLVEAVYRNEVDVLVESADELLKDQPPDRALAMWMQLFVRHVATKRGMLSVLKPMLETSPSVVGETKGRATAAATKLLNAGVAAGTIRADVDGGDLIRAIGGVCMSTEQVGSDTSARLAGLLFDGLRHGAASGPPLSSTG